MALAAILILALITLVVPRRYAVAPLLLSATTMPMAQRMVIAGADFNLLRLILLAYLARIIFRSEWRNLKWNSLDTLIVLWVVSGTIIMTIHFGTTDALVNRLGWSYDILLTYFAARCLIREWNDLIFLAKFSAFLSIPIAALFVFEWITRYNIFSMFGGVPFETRMREGRLRIQGPFAHPILAGTFWAAMLPMIWMMLKGPHSSRLLAYTGTACALLIVIASSSSTPLLSLGAALLAVATFPFRHYRKHIWVGLIILLITLHFLMNNPVWHLMARIDFVGGSTGWHRYIIFDTFISHFPDWFLTGNHTPGEWRWQMRDITNQYILEGLRGGILTLSIFLLVLITCFRYIGGHLKASVSFASEHTSYQWIAWLAGTGIFVHVVTFFGVSYFGQMIPLLFLQLALPSALHSEMSPTERR